MEAVLMTGTRIFNLTVSLNKGNFSIHYGEGVVGDGGVVSKAILNGGFWVGKQSHSLTEYAE
jgi:hypothetical protein